ncbi:hypothetical protein F2Q69_00048816 [Brassica cretica]|uniref:Uncharacterized protein n=1 Tax=Brassica cretica TaxID=69181 RepID=A0A8S9PNP5_BRACR|nr:hypothetical protein F2Q69_00048816 [Brassica cretica]
MSVHVAPPQGTSELQTPQSPRHHQKPRRFPSSKRISRPSSTRPRSDIGDTDHPPGSVDQKPPNSYGPC